jgi:hypothetical protein
MEKPLELLLNSVKGSIDSLQYVADQTTDINGMVLISVIDVLKAQELVIRNISCILDKEKSIKNRALDFICKKGFIIEFYKTK